ncbi:MAG: ABC transporter ATP-binding protein, partial [bacterium]
MEQLVKIKNLTKKYGKTKVALNDVSLEINRGRIVGLLGANGSGKTTLIKTLAGVLSIDEGEVLIDGLEIGAKTKAIVSYLPDVSYINDNDKIDEIISYFMEFYDDFDEQRARGMFERLGIDTTHKYKTLSKGTKEKVQLVMVMSRRAKLYLLDEPIAGVDPAGRDYILNTIIQNYDENATIIICT